VNPGNPTPDRPALSVVVPVYDERENLEALHASILSALAALDFEILYVDDGSTDGSSAILDTLAQGDPRVRVIHFVRNYGQTAALTAGFRNARAKVLVTLDADGQNDPADIPLLLGHLDRADVICGWRRDRKDPFLHRTLPSRVANWLISRLSKVPLHDYGCTLRAYRAEFIEGIPLYGEMHRFIPIYVTWAGARILEVPVRHHPRLHGRTKYGLSRIPKVLLDLTTLKFLRDFFVTPIYFFGWLGFSLVFAGAASLLGALLAFALGSSLLAVAFGMMGPILGALGLVEITLGIVAEVLIRMHYEIQAKEPYRIKGDPDPLAKNDA
jgi:glycosyltransferase involved in cell wall biosynthesis